MTNAEKTAIKERIAAWDRAAPVLQQMRDEDIRTADTHQAMDIFAGSAEWAVTNRPAAPTSGLVAQQRWFMKFRRA
jgi:hypothetical protein